MGVPEEEWNNAWSIVDPAGVEVSLYFQKVPEGKQGKNRLHLDVMLVGDDAGTPVEIRKAILEKEVVRLTALGAKILYRLEEGSHYHVTMADPEGNEFCVC
jgi:Glyoxalase-like domain